MSKWNRPMRRFQSASLRCARCHGPIRISEFGGWTHIRRERITDPGWHIAQPSTTDADAR